MITPQRAIDIAKDYSTRKKDLAGVKVIFLLKAK